MPRSVTVFSGELLVELRFQSEDRAESTSACLYLGDVVLPLRLTDEACSRLLAHLMAQRAYGPADGGSR